MRAIVIRNRELVEVMLVAFVGLASTLVAMGCSEDNRATHLDAGGAPSQDASTDASDEWSPAVGYAVHVLTGDSLSAQKVTINGLSVDTTSVIAIDNSVQAIVDSTNAPEIVEVAKDATSVSPDLTVDFTGTATPVPPTFHGADLHWRSKFFMEDPRWRALVKHLPLGLLRFPGGQERVRYDGKGSISGTVAEDTLAVTATQPYEYRISGQDVASFIGLCKDLGIAAEPEINLTVDDAKMWADLVTQIVSDLNYDLNYISVGNEPDIKSSSGNWDILGATGATDDARRSDALARYTARYLKYQVAINAVKPGLTYAIGELGSWGPSQLGSYLDTILSGIGSNQPGAVSDHWYMLGDWGQSASDSSYPSLGHLVVTGNGINSIGYLKTIASTMRDTAAAHGLTNPKLFIGEFGTSWSATAADAAMADRLAAAIFNVEAQETGKMAGFDSMQWFGLSDPSSFAPWVPSLIAVDGSTGTPNPRPQYYVYLMYKHLYGNETIAVAGGQQPDWSIYASRDSAKKNYLMFINRTPATSLRRVLRVVTTAGERLLRFTLEPHSVSIVAF
jgi:hypothetical protein